MGGTVHAAHQETSQGEGVCDTHTVCSLGESREGAWVPVHSLWSPRQEQLQSWRGLHQEHHRRKEGSQEGGRILLVLLQIVVNVLSIISRFRSVLKNSHVFICHYLPV